MVSRYSPHVSIFARHKIYLLSVQPFDPHQFRLANYSSPSSQHLQNQIQHQQQASPVRALFVISRVVIATLRTRLGRQLWNFQVAHNGNIPVYRTPHFRCDVAMSSFWVPVESLHHAGIQWSEEWYNLPLWQLYSTCCYGHGRDSKPPPIQEPLLVQISLR